MKTRTMSEETLKQMRDKLQVAMCAAELILFDKEPDAAELMPNRAAKILKMLDGMKKLLPAPMTEERAGGAAISK